MRDLIKHGALLWLVVFQQLWLVHLHRNACWKAKKSMLKIHEMSSIAKNDWRNLINNSSAFVGGSYLAKYLSGHQKCWRGEEAWSRCGETPSGLWKVSRTKLLDWIAANDRLKDEAKQNFTDTDYALKLHSKVHNQELDLRQPLFSEFYKLHLRSRLRKECLKQAIWQIYLPAPENISRPTFDVQFPNSVHQADLLSSWQKGKSVSMHWQSFSDNL